MQAVFQGVVVKADIKKATVQSLRHSFTTHLLEGSTDLHYIQAFSGHGSSQLNGEIVNPLERAAGKFKV